MRLLRSFILLAFLAVMLTPSLVRAADTCTCYCGDTTNGADSISGTFDSSATCRSACEDAKVPKTYVTCAQGTSDLPLANALCFTEDECTKAEGVWKVEEQPAECPFAYHYCYPTPVSTTLNVAIGATTKTVPIADYINLLYTYSLGVAALIAVVMIMIGGAQYIVGARGNTEEVSKAKDRIRNAVVGLVLLLSAYLVLATVNPNLVKFTVLKAPLIKPTLFLTGSCDDFDNFGYDVEADDAGETQCGDTGVILADPSGNAVNSTCVYNDCSESGDSSRCGKKGTEYACMSCVEAGDRDFLASGGFVATGASCAALSYVASGVHHVCTYERIGALYSAAARLSGYGITTDFCADIVLDCNSILHCGSYETALVNVGEYGTGLLSASVLTSGATSDENNELRAICQDNPCRTANGPCTFNAEEATCRGSDGR